MIKLNSLPCDRTTSIWMQTLPVNPTTSWPSWVKRNNASMYVELFGQWIRKTLAHHAISSHPTTPKGTPSTVLLWSTAHDVALKRLVMYRDHVHPGILLVQQFVCQLLTAIGVFGERTNVQEAHAQP
ncbi:hypothetical protein RvY_17983-2 [Ramazzottius varieornatus]|uniref:Uncharacterized protein n=1 Tax=Ramazzottius varieornatus TaxID=947166 RepID=A0A1D1W444_RAMVA|nr:hypothetical protein RvY_17983-2 [Ramazzottius varieornatus]